MRLMRRSCCRLSWRLWWGRRNFRDQYASPDSPPANQGCQTVVKKLWEYIKANQLQNPLQKTEIVCDEKLRPIFNVDKIHMFTMNKVFQHLLLC